jgi:hypothetical protein
VPSHRRSDHMSLSGRNPPEPDAACLNLI